MKKLCQGGSLVVLAVVVAAAVAMMLSDTGARARGGAADEGN